MFAKVYSQIYDSSIAEDYQVRQMFMDLLVLADCDGVVDMTISAISLRTRVPRELVERAIGVLSQPDKESRSPVEDGRRLVLIDSHRTWGWKIVNYEHYRKIRDDEGRRSYFRDYKRTKRAEEKAAKPKRKTVHVMSTTIPQVSKNVTHAEAEAEGEEKEVPSFDVFWAAYPNHVNKKKASEKWDRLKPEDKTAAVAALPALKASEQWLKNGGEFIPHPTTYLNGERWNDAPPPKPNVVYFESPHPNAKRETGDILHERLMELIPKLEAENANHGT